MLPPEGLITLFGGLFIGLVSGIVSVRSKNQALAYGAYFAAFILAIILGAVIEADAAAKIVFYGFGDGLLKHLAVAIISVTVAHLVIVGIARLTASNNSQTRAHIPGQPRAYIPHALGLFNLFFGVGCLAQLIYWGVNRNNSVASEEVKEALKFQAMYLAVLLFIGVLGAVTDFIPRVITLFITLPWLTLTIIAIIQAKRNGTFTYPLNVRFLRRSQQANPVI